jgi:hypothetical protein
LPTGRHRRTLPWQVRLQRWGALPAAVLAATAVVPVAAALEPTGGPTPRLAAAFQTGGRAAERAQARTVSRDVVRPEPAAPRMADVVALELPGENEPLDLSPRWVSDDVKVWSDSDEGSRRLTVLDDGDKVQVTGVVHGDWAQISYRNQMAWVNKKHLTRTKPASGGVAFASSSSARVSGAPCSDGSAVESGLQTNTIKVYRSVCAAFPAVSSWGGRTGSGDHGAGLALDIMCTGSLGDAIAAYVRAHASELGVSEVIWSQHIWTVQRSSEGWRPMSDRGSTTANHYDHVHVSVY